MTDSKRSTTNRVSRLIQTIGNRQIWEVNYAWLNGKGLMIIEGGSILDIQRL